MNTHKLLIVGIVIFLTGIANADVQSFQNDGFTLGGQAVFQPNFQPGEVLAARFEPAIQCPCLLTEIALLFGGSDDTRSIAFKIWEDPNEDAEPTTLLRHEFRTLSGSDTQLQTIDLRELSVVVNGPFRVGFQILQTGLPAPATDADGTMNTSANFVLINNGSFDWFPSTNENMQGDFIIRATVDNIVLDDVDDDGFANAEDNCMSQANPKQQDSDNDLIGNACDPDVAEPNDCVVNFLDFAVYRDNFQLTGDLATDNNGDGVTNFIDFAVFANYFLNAPGPSALGCDAN